MKKKKRKVSILGLIEIWGKREISAAVMNGKCIVTYCYVTNYPKPGRLKQQIFRNTQFCGSGV